MHVIAISTPKITPNSASIFDILDGALPALAEGTVVAVTSKIISLCEGSAVPGSQTDWETLIKQQTAYYIPAAQNQYKASLSITHNLLIASGGIDRSNAGGYCVLLPKDAQESANAIRNHLCGRHGIKSLGVIITDSASRPFQVGTTGLAIAHSGFEALRQYRGETDLFGYTFRSQKSSVMNGLAAAAVLVMGEGAEQTPVAVMYDLPFVKFQHRNPTAEELNAIKTTLKNDLYGPILQKADWQKGDLAE